VSSVDTEGYIIEHESPYTFERNPGIAGARGFLGNYRMDEGWNDKDR